MNLHWPGTLTAGDVVEFEDHQWTIVGVSATHAQLADRQGSIKAVELIVLQRQGRVVRGGGARRPPITHAALAGFSPAAADAARRWEPHIVEVLTGRRVGDEGSSAGRHEFDPRKRSLAQREEAKAAELREAGWDVTAHTVKRMRQRFQARGVAGLVDGRSTRRSRLGERTDPRVLDAIQAVAAAAVDGSTVTVDVMRFRVEQLLEADWGRDTVAMPSLRQFYRIFNDLTRGQHTTGSAKTRRSQASKPPAPYGVYSVTRPGELVEIDATPLDIAVNLGREVVARIELVAMIDVATRSVLTAVLTPTAKSVDAALMLARAMTPEPLRPGWSQALSLVRSILPNRDLVDEDVRLANASARPLVLPETIVYDQGAIFISANFRAACDTLGIDLQPAHPGSGAEKPHIEKMNSSFGTLFCQYASGYLGRSVEHRGRKPEVQPLWTLFELQDLLDQWTVCTWQNRKHAGLRDPRNPKFLLTPNQKYAALVEVAGIVPVALSPDDYVSLLPMQARVVNAYGIKIDHRIYDDEALTPFRRQRSRSAELKDKFEVRYDPYDVSRIWVRDHWGLRESGQWFTVYWTQLKKSPVPFGTNVWEYAVEIVRRPDGTVLEEEAAAASAEILRTLSRGPEQPTPAKADKRAVRAAARTLAHGPSLTGEADLTHPGTPAAQADAPAASTSQQPDQADETAVEPAASETHVTGIFNPREEALKWY